MPDAVDSLLTKLASLIAEGRFEEVETDVVEVKPVPADSGEWKELHKSVNAFLNTRGGILLLGFKEVGTGPQRHWTFTGYRAEAEPKLKELASLFSDSQGRKLQLPDSFPPPQIRNFQGGKVGVVYVDELPADQKYAFYKNEAWRRILTGDHRLTEAELAMQEEYRAERWHARELEPVADATMADLDLDQLNEYIQQLNRPVKIETIKPDLESARGFLERKGFLKDGTVTTLGLLVCGKHPEDRLGFRCHVHGYVDVPQAVAQDKQDLIGNILPLMQGSLSYILRNIQVGVSIERGGTSTPQYPEEVLRETVNNALAHRDYSINKQAIISIKPGLHVSIRNPGSFRQHLLLDYPNDAIPLRRIIPEAKARNPKLADVLRVYRKWEGKGIGMATLVNLALDNRIDVPTYRLYGEEVCLFLRAGGLYGERMRTLLSGFDAYLAGKLGSRLSAEQERVLAYVMKSEWENERFHHTILLTPDNNHFEELLSLERAGLIEKHARSTSTLPIYVADRVLMRNDYRAELEAVFGDLSTIAPLARRCLNLLERHGKYSTAQALTARQAAFALWSEERGAPQDVREFESFYRKVKAAFNSLEKGEYAVRDPAGGRGLILNRNFEQREKLL